MMCNERPNILKVYETFMTEADEVQGSGMEIKNDVNSWMGDSAG